MKSRKFNDNWKEYVLYDLANWKNGLAFNKINFSEDGYPIIKIAELKNGITSQTNFTKDKCSEEVYLRKNDLIFSWSGNPETSIDAYLYDLPEGYLNQHSFKVTPHEFINKYFLFYVLKYLKPIFKKIASNKQTTGLGHITISDLKNLRIKIPTMEIQEKFLKIIKRIDDKIKLNNQTNDNLSEQLKQIFNNKFYDKIQNNDCSEFKEYILYDVLDVIDNRGKTPKLVEVSNYPIIDVRAISGENRIIDYKQCQKYVDDEVYNTFFRSGHPKINDILISTVGSLAEMKIYMENKGTIAQNVVALRSKYDYPMYIYQYLKAIKNDLISYNIGSVQPSIKVTQFMKHNIYIPKDKELYEFENIAKLYTDKMFNISKENETLEQLRDTLLPKLMNGEIDLDKIEI